MAKGKYPKERSVHWYTIGDINEEDKTRQDVYIKVYKNI